MEIGAGRANNGEVLSLMPNLALGHVCLHSDGVVFRLTTSLALGYV